MAFIADGKFEQGISELQRAYEILPHPNLVYNIARAHAEAGEVEEAVAAYRKYLDGGPPDREEVSQMVAALEARLRRQEAMIAAAQKADGASPAAPTTVTPGTTPAPRRAASAPPLPRPHPSRRHPLRSRSGGPRRRTCSRRRS